MEQIAIIHFTNYPKGQSRACMGAVMKYTKQEKKTLWEGHKLVSGINCRPESVYDDFLRTKLLYHKEGGTMFYHMVQSFPLDEKVNPAIAHPWATREQAAELIREIKKVRRLAEQAGKKKERSVSFPTIRLPRPSLEWLLLPAVLLGLLVLWYGWVTLWNGLTTLFP